MRKKVIASHRPHQEAADVVISNNSSSSKKKKTSKSHTASTSEKKTTDGKDNSNNNNNNNNNNSTSKKNQQLIIKNGDAGDNSNDDIFPDSLLLEDNNNKSQYQQKPSILTTTTTLFDGYIWVISNFFTSTECQLWINYFETHMKQEYVQQRNTRYLAYRECYRCNKYDTNMSQRIFQRMMKKQQKSSSNHNNLYDILSFLYPNEEPVTCNPNIRLYKYTKGMSFGKHIDESNYIPDIGGTTRMTILIYLSTCFGGATKFETPKTTTTTITNHQSSTISYQPIEGSMLLHIHGNNCLLHEAEPVLSGIKYVLRTDLVYAPKKKK